MIRFIPDDNANPLNPLKGPSGGWVDKFGNDWVRGPPHHFPGDLYEWDVQLPDGTHVNVSIRGIID
jgi:filamentous hemagglutinin